MPSAPQGVRVKGFDDDDDDDNLFYYILKTE
jgi:hypothetical protein